MRKLDPEAMRLLNEDKDAKKILPKNNIEVDKILKNAKEHLNRLRLENDFYRSECGAINCRCINNEAMIYAILDYVIKK